MSKEVSKGDVIAVFADYVMDKHIPFRFAVTLTLNRDVNRREQMDRDLNKFFNLLNDWISGSRNWKRLERQGKYTKLRNVTVVENGHGMLRMHAHSAIAFPSRIAHWQAEMLVKECWQQTMLGKGARIDVREIYDEKGWIEYISKEFTALNCEALDLNTYFGKKAA